MATSGSGDQQRKGAAGTQPALVLIVDDDASVRESSRRLIRSFGYRAEVFASGAELLASPLLALAACLLLDVRMPDMDGLEVQRRVVARGVAVPIVLISGHASDAEEMRGRAAGAIEFLRKPVAGTTLRAVLDNLIRDTGDAS